MFRHSLVSDLAWVGEISPSQTFYMYITKPFLVKERCIYGQSRITLVQAKLNRCRTLQEILEL
jgi:hypothetical protein